MRGLRITVANQQRVVEESGGFDDGDRRGFDLKWHRVPPQEPDRMLNARHLLKSTVGLIRDREERSRLAREDC